MGLKKKVIVFIGFLSLWSVATAEVVIGPWYRAKHYNHSGTTSPVLPGKKIFFADHINDYVIFHTTSTADCLLVVIYQQYGDSISSWYRCGAANDIILHMKVPTDSLRIRNTHASGITNVWARS